MKTYKKGISLIVLVITVIVLAILATTVIISLSSTNIIEETANTTFKSDMANLKTAYELYVASELMADVTFDRTSLNITSTDSEFEEIFGDNVPEKYKENLKIVNGKIVYYSTNSNEVEVLEDVGMNLVITPVSEIKIGDLVSYIPQASATGNYSGATYVLDNDENSDKYGTYIESTIDYTPGVLKWVYLGQDENGNTLLTSQEPTSFTMTIAGQDGFVTGPDRMDALCNTLYGNSTYGIARNIKVEDLNRVFEYNGPYGYYYSQNSAGWGAPKTTSVAKSFNTLATELKATFSSDNTPRLDNKALGDYLSDAYSYSIPSTGEKKVLGYKTNGKTYLPNYWVSSACSYLIEISDTKTVSANFCLRYVAACNFTSQPLFRSNGNESVKSHALRPVVVLNSNIQFGEKNLDGEWSLVKM